MRIPQGTWIVVRRAVRDSTSRGDIVKAGLTEKQAKLRAKVETSPRFNYWAMDKAQY